MAESTQQTAMPRYITISLLALAISPPLQAANFYKYVDADGVVTYGNQQPANTAATRPSQAPPKAQRLGLPEPTPTDNQRLQALLQQDLVRQILQNSLPAQQPEALSEPTQSYSYARPWKDNAHPITQGFNGSFSHNTPQSRYAVDVAMPEGTAIYAARNGTVLSVRNGEQGRGTSPNGNYLRILHSDGTSSAYLHLQNGSISVTRGQHVEKGQRLANSGNTGRSTGPHLHFVVQQHTNGRFESIPFHFDNPPPQLPNFAAHHD